MNQSLTEAQRRDRRISRVLIFIGVAGLVVTIISLALAVAADLDLLVTGSLYGLMICGVSLIIALGRLPGVVARQHNHPRARAIEVLGWLGLVTYGLLWIVALVWAYMPPVPRQSDQ